MNRSFNLSSISLVAFTVVFPFLGGCSHQKPRADGDNYSAKTSDRTSNPIGSELTSDSGNAYGLRTIHFPFDSNSLDQEAKAELKGNAEILAKNAGIHIQVEGHCDARGGIQYNIALGERRAKAVKHFLEDLGLRAERIATISYGKERPLDMANTEEAYAKNRRANFVVTKGLQ